MSHDGTPPGCPTYLICCFSLRLDDEVEKAVYLEPIIGEPLLSTLVFERTQLGNASLPTVICLSEIDDSRKPRICWIFWARALKSRNNFENDRNSARYTG